MLRTPFRSDLQLPRAVGFDDGPSIAHNKTERQVAKAALVGVWFEGLEIRDIRVGTLTVDSLDVTTIMLDLMRQVSSDIVFLSGATFAGFNIVDSRRIHETLGTPIIVVSRQKPDNASVKYALRKHFVDWKTRWRLISELGRIYTFARTSREPPLYFETVGLPAIKAKKIIRAYCVTSRVPDPVRVAGILGRGFAPAGEELDAC